MLGQAHPCHKPSNFCKALLHVHVQHRRSKVLGCAKGRKYVPQLVGFGQELAVAAFDSLKSFDDLIQYFCLSLQIIIVIFDLPSVPPALTHALCISAWVAPQAAA